MKDLIALFLFVSPGFACEHRSSFLHKMPDFQLLFWGCRVKGHWSKFIKTINPARGLPP